MNTVLEIEIQSWKHFANVARWLNSQKGACMLRYERKVRSMNLQMKVWNSYHYKYELPGMLG